jgi:hypothetical protein
MSSRPYGEVRRSFLRRWCCGNGPEAELYAKFGAGGRQIVGTLRPLGLGRTQA